MNIVVNKSAQSALFLALSFGGDHSVPKRSFRPRGLANRRSTKGFTRFTCPPVQVGKEELAGEHNTKSPLAHCTSLHFALRSLKIMLCTEAIVGFPVRKGSGPGEESTRLLAATQHTSAAITVFLHVSSFQWFRKAALNRKPARKSTLARLGPTGFS